MTRRERIAQLELIGNARGSDVLVYYLASRPGFNTHMNNDALPVIYEHLLALARRPDRPPKLDLLLHTHGGNAEVPWPLVNTCREHYEQFAVLLPGPCYSAGTMVALGADEIVMTAYANLGPIDPTLTIASDNGSPVNVAIEDVSAFIEFLQTAVGIKSEEQLAAMVALLANQTMPLTLGTVAREQKFNRLVADKLLQRRNEPPNDEDRESLISALTTDIGHHGHALGRREARELSLPITNASGVVAEAIWQLHLEYERLSGGRRPPTLPHHKVSAESKVQLGFIESTARFDAFDLIDMWRRRYEAPEISVNLNIQMPPELAQLLAQGQTPDPEMVQRFLQQVSEVATETARQQLLQSVPSRMERSFTALGWIQRHR